jgi:hypothetical protein
MRNRIELHKGADVTSQFDSAGQLLFAAEDFDESHIGIAAQFDQEGIYPNAEIERFWQALGATESSIWQPGDKLPGSRVIDGIIRIAVSAYLSKGLLPPETRHNIYGEAVRFDGIIGAHDPNDPYDDRQPHVDFVPEETPCAVALTSSLGGTNVWGGDYSYRGNLEPSYADSVKDLEHYVAAPGEVIFSGDARTFLHARGKGITNSGRALVRLFLGE